MLHFAALFWGDITPNKRMSALSLTSSHVFNLSLSFIPALRKTCQSITKQRLSHPASLTGVFLFVCFKHNKPCIYEP